jgi:hypothetical protein
VRQCSCPEAGLKLGGPCARRWTWSGIDMAACCGPEGFKVDQAGCSCTVKHARDPKTCPPAPYYSDR